MIALPNIYKKTVHDFDREQGLYLLRICPPGFAAVPKVLCVEDRRYNKFIRADLLLSGPKTKGQDGKRKADFFSGLQKTTYADVYTGSIRTRGKGDKINRDFLVVRFTPDANRLTTIYFPSFSGPYPNQRIDFVREIVGRGLI